jgi:hypothetical protein
LLNANALQRKNGMFMLMAMAQMGHATALLMWVFTIKKVNLFSKLYLWRGFMSMGRHDLVEDLSRVTWLFFIKPIF